ncbi:MAG: beta-ketoacyl-[acyl-carrier-protein] synthase family protein [Thermodesulfobacteriota bacterium]|nr:beta-ketoacyl-[acyl-carrier-protein] synthase family protein [Thermodesulfobacteriota bacterium]
MPRRVVITSTGVISSLGCSHGRIIDNLKKKNPAFIRSSFDKSVVTSPVMNFDIMASVGRFKERKYLNRGAQLCVASARMAVRDSGISREMLAKAGLFVGAGPNMDIGGEFPEIKEGKMDREGLMALWILKFLPNTPASAIARIAGIHGENLTVTTACAASLQAIGEAYRRIKDNYLNLAFAGGGDSRLSHGGILAYKKARAIFSGNEDPETVSRPFDESRKGFVPGEGGAFFLLEELEHAQARGATIYAEVCGFGTSMDGHNMTSPEPHGKWGEQAVLAALKEAGMSPDVIDVISSHGTGTYLNDIMEANMIRRIYGKHTPLVVALKSWIGHISTACGALELAICLTCMRDGYVPEIRNLKDPCLSGIDFVRKDLKYPVSTIMLQNFGFGGQNSALIIRKSEP